MGSLHRIIRPILPQVRGRYAAYAQPSTGDADRLHYVARLAVGTRLFRTSSSLLEMLIMKVPAMGDSITEGTLVHFNKNPGDYVNQDEVICVIETDKVSVDVRAPQSGTIVEFIPKLDEEVAVGGDLVKLDTAGSAKNVPPSEPKAVSPPATPSPSIDSKPTPQAEKAKTVTEVKPIGHRVPSIKFLGKRSKSKTSTGQATSASQLSMARSPLPKEDVSPKGAIPFDDTPSLFKHLPLSAEEMEAIDSGGASMF